MQKKTLNIYYTVLTINIKARIPFKSFVLNPNETYLHNCKNIFNISFVSSNQPLNPIKVKSYETRRIRSMLQRNEEIKKKVN